MATKNTADKGDGQLLLTVEQAAQRLGISRGLMYKMIGSGQMPSVKMGRLRRVSVAQLEMWLRGETPAPGRRR